MASALAPLIVIFAALLPGTFALLCWGKRFEDDPLDFLFAGLSLGLLALGWLALILAEVGRFSSSLLGALWAIGLIALVCRYAWQRRRRPALPGKAGINRWEVGALTLWIVLAAWLFFRPHEFILGGADAGVYVNLGANIARTGGILIHDPTLAALDPSLYGALLRPLPSNEPTPYILLPGFYVPVTPRGLVVPQFYPLHPIWQAIGYALGGLRAELLLTPLWGFLGALAVYFTTRRLWGWRAGMLALAALSFTALQVWFARYPTAEMLTQYLFWAGTWALIAWMDKREPRALWAALAGGALGQVFLARIDAYVLLGLPVLVGIWLWRTHDLRRQDAWFLAPFLLLAAHSLIHGVVLSGPYFFTLFRYGGGLISRSLIIPLAFIGLAVLALIVISVRPQWRSRAVVWLGARRAMWVTGAVILLAAIAVFGYFVRPHLGEVKTSAYWYGGGEIPNLDRENLVRLGWYLGPAGIALGVAGMCWMLIKELNRRTVFLLGTGLFFSLFYLWRIQANPHQVYAMRRYVPIVVPFFTVSAVYLVSWLYENLRGRWRWVSAGLTIIWFFGILSCARGFVSQVDYRGIINQLDEFNASIPPHSVLIVNDPTPVSLGDVLGTPLRFLYGHDVFTLRDPESLDKERFHELVRDWKAEARPVYWLSIPGGYPYPGSETELGSPASYDLSAQVLENRYEYKPRGLFDARWQFSIRAIADRQGQ
jgi:hypothetical protein